jgi:hypothetical protein
MARLLLETDDGTTHSIEIEHIKTEDIAKDDIIVARLEVGNIEHNEQIAMIGKELLRFKEMLMKAFDKTAPKVIVCATRNGVPDASITITKSEKKKAIKAE